MENAGESGIELEETTPGAPSRQQTLESQRQRQPLPWSLRRLPGGFRVAYRPTGPVDEAVEAGAKLYRSDAREFLQDFRHISHRPKARVQEIFEIWIRSQHMEIESEETTGMRYYHACLASETDRC